MNGLALFDLDRTLIDCNSGRLWLQAELRAGRVGVKDALWAAWQLGQYGMGRGDAQRAYEEAVKTLTGVDEQVIVDRTNTWFEAEVRNRLRPGGKAALEAHRSAGDRLVLATSGSLYSSRCAIAAYGLHDFICSRYEVLEGRFTGKMASSAMGAHKLDRVREWAEAGGYDLKTAAFYTDSVTDLALLEAVGRPVAVNADRPLARIAAERGWESVDWGKAS